MAFRTHTEQILSICSSSSIDAFSDILKSTAGIVFLGTPHRGSPAAGIAETARKAASVLLMDTNSLVLDSLSLKNSDLERCQDLFSSLWHKHHFVVKTFQEGLPLKIPLRIGQSKLGKVSARHMH
jgi:protein SERAC1